MSRAQTTFAEPQGANPPTPFRLHAPAALDPPLRSSAAHLAPCRSAGGGDPLSEFLARLHFLNWRCETTTLALDSVVLVEAGATAIALVLSGSLDVESAEGSRLQLKPGGLALLSAHGTLRASTTTPGLPHEHRESPPTLLTARFDASAVGLPLAGLLPPCISSAGCHSPGPLRDSALLSWLSTQATSHAPGSMAVASRFLQSLLIELLRDYLASSDGPEAAQAPAARGAYQATFDACLGPVMRLVHASPHRDWTVHSMARESGLSRSAFADRFRTVVGQPPLQYVTEIRMQKAAELLELTDVPVKRIAAQVGYESVSAFSSAFKRRFGVPPISLRQATAASSDAPAE
ncbi:AraC family transcriptional regulator [Lacipirellula parvula]|uniref:Transcriptional regulator n=1 Tax=Lacipirellula parvula TaxID=2650471 RepID=A0A5K7XJ44_9BACT|nr:helix-turn-helix domain-containing protein [Lacipirellula parvula]BBO34406.1 transcriptional regulator [Lacipirellula parvula]